jgi:hypothetical protein
MFRLLMCSCIFLLITFPVAADDAACNAMNDIRAQCMKNCAILGDLLGADLTVNLNNSSESNKQKMEAQQKGMKCMQDCGLGCDGDRQEENGAQ